ncbi:YciI family protein [Acerihabitans sp. TG2]|uniref:YciI family protein n=1 Tax=Acerihabitans sp. TG2 TaxID=3096008 RepID=UPI002B2293B9|nr:YciI family protein [Acerihabitans sp. TG2]MEA9391330.1 YciI family protein [Acerihabitans sp. TG2]
MFIVDLTYEEPMEKVEALLEMHVAWLQKHYTSGDFVASGRKVPRTGGIILTKSLSRSMLNEILAQDPFNAVANYSITEFMPSMTSDTLSILKSI